MATLTRTTTRLPVHGRYDSDPNGPDFADVAYLLLTPPPGTAAFTPAERTRRYLALFAYALTHPRGAWSWADATWGIRDALSVKALARYADGVRFGAKVARAFVCAPWRDPETCAREVFEYGKRSAPPPPAQG